jgi:hypothetical protein
MAVTTGLEPATSGVTGRHSNQLNYMTIFSELRFVVSKALQKYTFFSFPQCYA